MIAGSVQDGLSTTSSQHLNVYHTKYGFTNHPE